MSMGSRMRAVVLALAVAAIVGGCSSSRPDAPAPRGPTVMSVTEAEAPPEGAPDDEPDETQDPADAAVPDIDESAYVSGGFSGEGAGGPATIGYGWADDSGAFVGHVTVDHLVRDTRTADAVEGDHVDFVPTEHYAMPTNQQVPVLKTTGDVDVALIGPFDDNVAPVLGLTDGTRLVVTDFADAGEITVGQRVCHSGYNETTATMHEVCGAVAQLGATSHCMANQGSSTCMLTVKTDRADGFPGGPGDSGAAAYTYNPNGTITLVGTYKGVAGAIGLVEPTYAAMEVFGGHPYTTKDLPR
ncbi:hypothetical protein ACTXG7_16965 [Mycolicibacterium sp. Dal123E01]|uniref:hypothetical protein n=1 Tax=Mycolicibacterium sp. Dal123E01 TaxID=3457578 RepID=UPI00403EB03A